MAFPLAGSKFFVIGLSASAGSHESADSASPPANWSRYPQESAAHRPNLIPADADESFEEALLLWQEPASLGVTGDVATGELRAAA